MQPTPEEAISYKLKKNINKTTICIVVLSILLAGAIGFGVFELIQNNEKQNQISSLESSKNAVEQQEMTTNCETSNPDIAMPINSEEDTNSSVGISSESNAGRYIIWADAGYKIKIPADLDHIEYSITSDGQSVRVTGVKKGEKSELGYSEIASNGGGLGVVSIAKKSDYESAAAGARAELILEDGDNVITYAHPQSVYSFDNAQIQKEIEATNLISKMLKNPANYEKNR